MIRIITLNVGWGTGRSSAWIAGSNFSPEWHWRGYWICQAWTLWHSNKVHKEVSQGRAQSAVLIPTCLQHGEICCTYWTNSMRGEADWSGPERLCCHGALVRTPRRLYSGLASTTVLVEAMEHIIILWYSLNVAKIFFFSTHYALNSSKALWFKTGIVLFL